jgi:hypothetical protein
MLLTTAVDSFHGCKWTLGAMETEQLVAGRRAGDVGCPGASSAFSAPMVRADTVLGVLRNLPVEDARRAWQAVGSCAASRRRDSRMRRPDGRASRPRPARACHAADRWGRWRGYDLHDLATRSAPRPSGGLSVRAACRTGSGSKASQLSGLGLDVAPTAWLSDLPIRGVRPDMTPHLAAKRRAIARHRSQFTNLIRDDPAGFRISPEFQSISNWPFEVFIDA